MPIFSQRAQNGTISIPIRDTGGALLSNLVFNSPGASCYYVRPRGTPVQIPLVTLASAQAAHADGGFIAIDNAIPALRGLYRLDLPDAALAAGESSVVVGISFDDTEPTLVEVLLDPLPAVISGAVVDDVGNTASTFKTDLTEASVDAYKNLWLLWLSGALANEAKPVTAFNPTTDFVTVSPAFSAEPAAGDAFVFINR